MLDLVHHNVLDHRGHARFMACIWVGKFLTDGGFNVTSGQLSFVSIWLPFNRSLQQPTAMGSPEDPAIPISMTSLYQPRILGFAGLRVFVIAGSFNETVLIVLPIALAPTTVLRTPPTALLIPPIIAAIPACMAVFARAEYSAHSCALRAFTFQMNTSARSSTLCSISATENWSCSYPQLSMVSISWETT